MLFVLLYFIRLYNPPMHFSQHPPSLRLQPYIKYYAVSEQEESKAYKVFPTAGLVMGFQYKGELAAISQDTENKLATAGITGMTDSFLMFKTSGHTGTVLVYFTETGFAHFAAHPVHELFNMSLGLNELFDKSKVAELEEKLGAATIAKQRVILVDQFLLSQLKDIEADKLVVEAVKLIYASRGTIQIKELNKKLLISQSPFEKRFRKVVGTSAKKFASIVRFHSVLDNLNGTKSLTEICYENNFFDQAHFIKNFRQFTGDTPETFKRST